VGGVVNQTRRSSAYPTTYYAYGYGSSSQKQSEGEPQIAENEPPAQPPSAEPPLAAQVEAPPAWTAEGERARISDS
jgi:hypothetical protein